METHRQPFKRPIIISVYQPRYSRWAQLVEVKRFGSQEIQSEETKSEEKHHPACEKHNRANHLLAPYAEARAEGGTRAEKEIDEKI